MKNACTIGILLLLASVGQQLFGAPLVLPETVPAGFPGVALLYEAGTQGTGVLILDLRDAQRIETRGSICVIANLAPRLMLASQVQISRVDNGKRIRVQAERCLMDSFPCFPDTEGYELNGLRTNTSWSVDFSPSSIIRINGSTMSLQVASERFALIPPDGVLTRGEAEPSPSRDNVQTTPQGATDGREYTQSVQSYESYRFQYERAIRLRDLDSAEEYLLGVLQLIPDEEDKRHVEAKNLLLQLRGGSQASPSQ